MTIVSLISIILSLGSILLNIDTNKKMKRSTITLGKTKSKIKKKKRKLLEKAQANGTVSDKYLKKEKKNEINTHYCK